MSTKQKKTNRYQLSLRFSNLHSTENLGVARGVCQERLKRHRMV